MTRIAIWWGYAVELIAAALILVALLAWIEPIALVTFLRSAAIDIATLFCAVMFAAALGFLWSFYAKADTDFYRWLEEKGAFSVYLYATIYAIAVAFFSTACLLISKYVDNVSVGLVACYGLLLAVINMCSLVWNVAGLMRLNAKFNSLQKGA